MFRYFKPRAAILRARLKPNVSASSSSPMRLYVQRYSQVAPNTQAVRMKKAPLKLRNIFITGIALYACYNIYIQIVLGPLDKALQETAKQLPDDEFHEPAPPLFIPFPGTTKQLPIVPYKGNDPEFQEFMKISKDKDLLNQLRLDLVDMLRNAAGKVPAVVLVAGKKMRARRIWLDIDFPQMPPPSFERSGIEISDDAISWVTMPVDASIVYKIRNVLWPQAVFQSMCTLTKVLAVEHFRKLAEMFGIQLQTSHAQKSMDQLLARSQKLIKEMNGEPKVAGDVQRPLTAKGGIPQQPLDDKSKEIGGGAALPGKSTSKDDMLSGLIGNFKDIHQIFAKPILAAKIKYTQISKQMRSTMNLHPRGSVMVSGLVEIEAEKAFLVFDIVAAWDPKKKEYHAESMRLVLRRVQKKRQPPLNAPPRKPPGV